MIEFEIIAQGLFSPKQLVMSYNPSMRMKILLQTQAWMDTLWRQKLAEAKVQGTRLFDAPLFRFVKASVQDATLHIIVGDTSYKEYVTTRVPEFAAGRARHELGNALSVCSVVETSDNYILLERREGVDVYVGRYHVIGGFFRAQSGYGLQTYTTRSICRHTTRNSRGDRYTKRGYQRAILPGCRLRLDNATR